MSDQYLGEIRLFCGKYAPENWALCNGQLLSIQTYTALYSLIGTTYGGDGRTTFGLPDLRGRVPIHMGTAPSGTNYAIGASGGTEYVTLTTAQIPSHTHAANATTTNGIVTSPNLAYWANCADSANAEYSTGAGTVIMAPGALQNTGANSPHPNVMPFITQTFIIALQGNFPVKP